MINLDKNTYLNTSEILYLEFLKFVFKKTQLDLFDYLVLNYKREHF